jgi:hypothetical protein
VDHADWALAPGIRAGNRTQYRQGAGMIAANGERYRTGGVAGS